MNTSAVQTTPASRHNHASNCRCFALSWFAMLVFTLANPAGSFAAPPPSVTVLDRLDAGFRGPARVAVDPAGKVYVTDTPCGHAVVLDAFGRLVSRKENLAGPLAIAVDPDGRIYLSEEGSGSVSVFDANWNLLHRLGAGTNEFQLPAFIALDADGSGVTVFVSDSTANEIKSYRDGLLAGRFGRRGVAAGEFDCPAGLWLSPTGELFVVDQNNERMQVFDRGGAFLRSFSLRPPGATERVGRACGVTGDGAGRVHVSDTFQGHVRVFDAQGAFVSFIGGYGERQGQLRSPAGLAVDGAGRMLVASINNAVVERFGLDCFTSLTASPARQVVPVGATVTLSASRACGGAVSFQWRKDAVDLVDAGNVSGATNATLTLASVTEANAGQYSVSVTADGQPSLSPAATVAVTGPPIIITSPANRSVPRGSAASLTVTAQGQTLDYRWFFNGLPLDVPNQNTLQLAKVAAADDGSYWAVVSNAAGARTSAVARVIVLLPAEFLDQPDSQTVAERSGAAFSAIVNGTSPLSYQWQFNGAGLAGQTASTLLLTNLLPPRAGSYRLLATTPAGVSTSQVATLTVVPDTAAPQLVRAMGGRATNRTITLAFNEPVNITAAQAPANYTLLGPGNLRILSAIVNQATNVVLTLNGARIVGANYGIRVQNLTDTAYAPNVLSPNPTTMAVSAQIDLVGVNATAWKYLQPTNNALDAQVWKQPAYNDGAWSNGFGVFYGNRSNSVYQPNPNPNVKLPLVLNGSDPSNHLAYTVLNVFTNAGNAIRTTTYYFRTAFDFPSATNGSTLLLHSMMDDGAVVYLNGQEVYRVRMASGVPVFSTLASSSGNQSWSPGITEPGTALPLTGLKPGRNVLAVEVHQRTSTDSDATFGFWLESVVNSFLTYAPRLNLSPATPVAGMTLSWDGNDYALEAAAELNGPWSPIASASPFVFTPDPATSTTFFRLRRHW